MTRRAWLVLVGLTTVACRTTDSACDEVGGGGAGENVLIILTDDIGIDKTGAYGEHPSPPPTPNIDALAARGVLFRNAYASPTCSPTRASILTGRHPSHHGIGRWIYAWEESEQLPPDELTIPEVLVHSPYDYVSAAVGKWHLTGFDAPDPPGSPLAQGFDCHAGSLGNPLEAFDATMPLGRGYYKWEKSVDGEVDRSHRYMTSDNADEAVARLRHMREPWFLYVATNGAHDPLDPPPSSLIDGSLAPDASEREIYDAMVEATDTEIGRILAAIPDDVLARTTIIYMTDNGTPGHGITEPWVREHGKGTVYEPAVNVPLIIAGPRVAQPGTESDALVHAVDILPTVAEIAMVDVQALVVEEGERAGEPVHLDGHSLLPWLADPSTPSHREFVYTEAFWPNEPHGRQWTQQIIRDAEWKLARVIEGSSVTDQLFHVPAGSIDDGEDLLGTVESDAGAAAAYDRLLAALDAQVQDLALD